MSIETPARRDDRLLEANRIYFCGQQQQALRYVRNLYERIQARRFSGNPPLTLDHPGRPAAEQQSVREMVAIAHDIAEVSARYWLHTSESVNLDDNPALEDALTDAIQIAVEQSVEEHRIGNTVVHRELYTASPDLITEEVEIDLQKCGVDFLNREYFVRPSCGPYEGQCVCRLVRCDESTAVYSVTLTD